MSEVDKYKDQKEKLANLCDEHNLTFRLRHDDYPITLSIRPLQGMYEQISMLENAEDGKGRISQDAVLTFFLKDAEFCHQIQGTFTISETLLGKFRNIFKKLCNFWLQYYYRDTMESNAIKRGLLPVIDEDETEDQDGDPSADPEDYKEAELSEEEAGENDSTADEELITAAEQLVRMENKCTVSLLQRRLKLGYAKATHLIDLLEERGIVGPYKGSEPREVLAADTPEDDEEE